jgi:hypothetical protein
VALFLLDPLPIAMRIYIAQELLAGVLLIAFLFAILISLLVVVVFAHEAGHRLSVWVKTRGRGNCGNTQLRRNGPETVSSKSHTGELIPGHNR